MKRAVCAVAFILLSASPLFAIKTNLIDDVIRMSKSGVADETIIDYVNASSEQLTVTADDIVAMKNAGVSDAVIKAVVDKESAAASQPETPPQQTPDSTAASDEPPAPGGGYEPGCWTFEPPVALAWPIYAPIIPSQLWDPYWYQPRLDTKSGAPVRTSGGAGMNAPPRTTAPPARQPIARPDTREHSEPVAREHSDPPPHDRSEGSRPRPSPSGPSRSGRSR